nr:putative phosphoribosylpyrophosphate synthetase [Actinobacillus pleuropneumoniae]
MLLGEDLVFFKENIGIQEKYLISFDNIINYFGIYRKGTALFLTDELKVRNYWLRNIGHEEKKISRIIRSLAWCGHLELAQNLQKLAIALIQEKGVLKEGTLDIWQHLLDEY